MRVLFSVTLLTVLLRRTDAGRLLDLLAGAPERPGLLAVAAILPGVGSLVGVLRWRALLDGLGARLRVRTLMAAVLVGAFFNQFLPSTLGGDVVRSWWAERAVGSNLVSLTVVAVDRAAGFVGFCLVGGLAAALHPALVREVPGVWLVLAAALLAMAGAAVLVHPRVEAAGSRLFRRPALRTVRERVGRVYAALRAFRGRPDALVRALLLSMVIQLVIIVQYGVLAGMLQVPVALRDLAVVIPIVTLVSLLPVTINGVGLREGALATLGASIGLATVDAVALAWAFLFFQLVWAALGGVIWLAAGRRRGRPDVPAPAEAPRVALLR